MLTLSEPSSEVTSENFFKAVPTRLENNPRGNLLVTIKSEVLEKFFLSICPDREEILKGRTKEVCPYMAQAMKPDGDKIFLMRMDKPIKGLSGTYQDSLLLTDRMTPNMSLITAVGLGEGVDFVFKDLYTAKQVNTALDDMAKRALELYKDYAKPIHLDIEVIIRQKFE